ncbi:hypothetical protein [Luteimonas sp. A478]
MNKAWGVGLAVLFASSQMPVAAGQGLERGIDLDMLTEGFLGGHPDIRWQREAAYRTAGQVGRWRAQSVHPERDDSQWRGVLR